MFWEQKNDALNGFKRQRTIFQFKMFSCSFFYKKKGHFTNTFPIGNVVAPHDSSSLSLVTLRRCPSRLNDEESAKAFCDSLI